MKMRNEFVEYIPKSLENGVLYISMIYSTVVHKCPCGCNEKVVTPLDAEKGWQLNYDGVDITLKPSIGNWTLDCRSHYWIRKSKVSWDGDWKSNEESKNYKGKKPWYKFWL